MQISAGVSDVMGQGFPSLLADTSWGPKQITAYKWPGLSNSALKGRGGKGPNSPGVYEYIMGGLALRSSARRTRLIPTRNYINKYIAHSRGLRGDKRVSWRCIESYKFRSGHGLIKFGRRLAEMVMEMFS